MADRILGMGDVVSLVERAQDVYDEKKARELSKKIAKNKFGFDDFLNQINQIKKMGNKNKLIYRLYLDDEVNLSLMIIQKLR